MSAPTFSKRLWEGHNNPVGLWNRSSSFLGLGEGFFSSYLLVTVTRRKVIQDELSSPTLNTPQRSEILNLTRPPNLETVRGFIEVS